MSATGRGSEREPNDAYYTPAWVVRRLLERLPIAPGACVIEPCAGSGAIVKALRAMGHAAGIRAYELTSTGLQHESRVEQLLRAGASSAFKCDWLQTPMGYWTDRSLGASRVILTNPPYQSAQAFVEKALGEAPDVRMLLRLNWLASARRAGFLRSNPPDVYVLPNRPSFRADGKTDACEYAWFVWQPRPGRIDGKIEILASTPKSERKA